MTNSNEVRLNSDKESIYKPLSFNDLQFNCNYDSANMALINASKVDFDDLRLIVCINGFTLDESYQIVELGFWSRKISGVIPFKSTKVWSKLNHMDKLTVNYLTNEYHGIELSKLKNQDALHQSDIFGAIRSIYHLCDDGVENRKLIGYLGNSWILDTFGKIGIGNYLVKLQEMFPNCEKFSIDNIRKDESYGTKDFAICGMHGDLNSGLMPNCARAISNYLADYCQKKSNKI